MDVVGCDFMMKQGQCDAQMHTHVLRMHECFVQASCVEATAHTAVPSAGALRLRLERKTCL